MFIHTIIEKIDLFAYYRPQPTAKPIDRKVRPESVRGQFLRSIQNMKKDFNAQQRTSLSAIKHDLNPDKS